MIAIDTDINNERPILIRTESNSIALTLDEAHNLKRRLDEAITQATVDLRLDRVITGLIDGEYAEEHIGRSRGLLGPKSLL